MARPRLFNSIVGYHPIDNGSIEFDEREISKLLVGDIAQQPSEDVPADPDLFENGLCGQYANLCLASQRCRDSIFASRRGEIKERAEHLLEFVGLYSKRNLISGDLSFGQQKLLEFAMALMNEPKVLLLDEPTAGINPTLINGLIDRLRKANEELGITLCVIEHNMQVIMNLAEHIYCLSNGHMLADGKPEVRQNDQRVIDAYLGGH